MNEKQWDATYAMGKWDYLNWLEQTPRYGVIAGYVQHLWKSGHILDVGCGQATLYSCLDPNAARTYWGIEWSVKAIELALQKRGKLHLIAGDIMRPPFRDGVNFGAIIFNEVLYCLTDPIGVFKRYLGLLASGGIVVVSMYAHNRPGQDRVASLVRQIWISISQSGLQLVAAADVTNTLLNKR